MMSSVVLPYCVSRQKGIKKGPSFTDGPFIRIRSKIYVQV